MESRETKVDGLRVHAKVGNASGPPLIFVHGLGVSSRYLLPTAKLLAPSFTVYAPDLPGTGRSEKPRRALDVPQLARALLGWLDAMQLDRASFLGNSLGCQVLIELAVIAPERVDRLVLTGPTVDPRWRTLAKQIPRWLLEATREPLALLPVLVRDYLIFGPLRFLRSGRFALEDRVEDKLSHVRAPSLVVRGARDAFVSAEWLEQIVSRMPNARAATIAGAAHAVTYSQPAALARLVLGFLGDRSPEGLHEGTLERDRRAMAAFGREKMARAPAPSRSRPHHVPTRRTPCVDPRTMSRDNTEASWSSTDTPRGRSRSQGRPSPVATRAARRPRRPNLKHSTRKR